ncbi:MAG: hypothetical protein IKL23_00565, partial [Oscillospiraceae bacterium]|nr:hypothetical protein [Oscillospiraceae bacterium]
MFDVVGSRHRSQVRFAPGELMLFGQVVRYMDWESFSPSSDDALWEIVKQLSGCGGEGKEVFYRLLQEAPDLYMCEFYLSTEQCEYFLHMGEEKVILTHGNGMRYVVRMRVTSKDRKFTDSLRYSLPLLQANTDEEIKGHLAKLQLLGLATAEYE